eukprot:9487674-Pyramimonas_sp.AAC.1
MRAASRARMRFSRSTAFARSLCRSLCSLSSRCARVRDSVACAQGVKRALQGVRRALQGVKRALQGHQSHSPLGGGLCGRGSRPLLPHPAGLVE